MPGSATAFRQERLKKGGVRPNTPVLFTINEEDEQQKNSGSKKQKGMCCLCRQLGPSVGYAAQQIVCFADTGCDLSVPYFSKPFTCV